MIRRDVLKLGSVATVGLALPSSVLAARAGGQAPRVIVDPRFEAARVFAGAAVAAHAQVLHSDGDLASLWHGALRGASPDGLMGLTGYADMVMASGIAAEARRSFRFCMSHQLTPGEPGHRVSVGSPAQVDVLKAAGEQWPLALWSMVATHPAGAIARHGHAQEAGVRAGTMWSWAIA